MSDEKRYEIERLVAMGRERMGPPSPRQMLIARMIDASAWSEHAQEQIDWCARNGLLNSPPHFGAMHMIARRLALIKANEIIRAQKRQDAGLSDLTPLDAMALSSRLQKKAFELYRAAAPRNHVAHEPAGEVFFLKKADGIPVPAAKVLPTGAVTLTWEQSDRTARILIGCDKKATLTFGDEERGVDLMLHGFKTDTPRLLTMTTDWVYHDGPDPRQVLDLE